MSLTLYCLIAIPFFSCSTKTEKELEITVRNHSNSIIDSVRIRSYGVDLFYGRIIAGQSIQKKIRMNYEGTYEGAFSVLIYNGDSLRNSGTFGYFANIADVRSKYTLTVFEDYKFREN